MQGLRRTTALTLQKGMTPLKNASAPQSGAVALAGVTSHQESSAATVISRDSLEDRRRESTPWFPQSRLKASTATTLENGMTPQSGAVAPAGVRSHQEAPAVKEVAEEAK